MCVRFYNLPDILNRTLTDQRTHPPASLLSRIVDLSIFLSVQETGLKPQEPTVRVKHFLFSRLIQFKQDTVVFRLGVLSTPFTNTIYQ